MKTASPLLSLRDLTVSFASRDGAQVPAVLGVSLTVYPRQVVAIVGESGSGKSVTAMSILRLLRSPPARYLRGTARFDFDRGPVDLLQLPDHELRSIRGGRIAMIFQEPMTSLNPVMTVGAQIAEAVRLHRKASRSEANTAAVLALEQVGIVDAPHRAGSYPHEFSGGMRQRVMIAMALACRPALLLADEPTTALDVTVQSQILDLISGLRQDLGTGVVLITHDLGIVASRADVVCVMYAGRVVEYADVYSLFRDPLHPYTKALLACVPGRGTGRLPTVGSLLDRARGRAIPTPIGPFEPWLPAPSGPHGDSHDAPTLFEVRPGRWLLGQAGERTSGHRSDPDTPFRREAPNDAPCSDESQPPSRP